MASTDIDAASQAVLGLLDAAAHAGVVITRTKVAKLLYLADLRAVEQLGAPKSGIDWHWLHYGPFDRTLLAVEGQLVRAEQVRREETTNFYGTPEYRLALHGEAVLHLDLAFRSIIADVVSEFGNLAPSTLRDLTYQTAPMTDAQKNGDQGEPLDLFAGRPVPDVRPVMDRLRRVLEHLEEQHDDEEAAEEMVQEIEELAPLRARANRALLD